MGTLKQIDNLSEQYADASQKLFDVVSDMNAAVAAVRKKYLLALKVNADATQKARTKLHRAIENSPKLFEKPRTQTLHGVKVGLAKGKDSVEYDDEDEVIDLIKTLFPEKRDVLLSEKVSVSKTALLNLSKDDLESIDVRKTEGKDTVVIKSPADSIAKAVSDVLAQAS